MLNTRNIRQFMRRGLAVDVLWDLFMILVAIINLLLISFDYTYLWMRPTYQKHIPALVKTYDEFMGIEPHRATEKYMDLAEKYLNAREGTPVGQESAELKDLSRDLAMASRELVEENPFERAGLTGNLEQLKKNIREWRAGRENREYDRDISSRQSFAIFWNMDSPAEARERRQFYREQMRPLLAANYFRHYDVNGNFVNQFWKLDLPFLILFVLELLVRWVLAIRRRTYQAWFLFPLYNWYDFVALIPLHSLRFFRLFRIVSIYIRLARSQLTTVGEDFISRWVRQYSNIIKEEIADMVTIRVLSEMQDEIRGGATVEVFTKVLEDFRDRVRDLILQGLRAGLEQGPVKANIRVVMERALAESARESTSLKPVPRILKEAITKDIGLAVYDSILESLTTHVQPGNQKAMEEVIDYFIDEAIRNAKSNELIELSETITLEILENMKEKVAVKKWADDMESRRQARREKKEKT